MVFSSYIFLFAFLPLVLLGYYLLSRLKYPIYQRLFLIGASLFFYGYFNPSYLLIIVLSIFVNYLLAACISGGKGRFQTVCFWLGILFNVGLLGYFKYRDFFVENINALFHTSFLLKHIALPLGISFFTFQQLSFLVSIRKGEERLERFDDYCIFVLFFPQLVAGPIVLYSEMIPQFKDPRRRYWNWDNAAAGAYIFTVGLFKKTVIADTLALFVDTGFGATSLGFCAAWATALSYTFQVYFDFSGYSDMAVGLGKLFNIDIPFNFRSPYQSESIGVFWRRWHITLSRALQSYVYFPLGGSREGKLKTYRNLLITFLVSGLWHGAAWTFVLWGGLGRLFQASLRPGWQPGRGRLCRRAEPLERNLCCGHSGSFGGGLLPVQKQLPDAGELHLPQGRAVGNGDPLLHCPGASVPGERLYLFQFLRSWLWQRNGCCGCWH